MRHMTLLALILAMQPSVGRPQALTPPVGEVATRTLPAIRLYTGAPPTAAKPVQAEATVDFGGIKVLTNVSDPTLTPVLPAPGKVNGAAVIIAPGGGYGMLSIDIEGYQEAQWLAERGVAAFVLKYRTKPFKGGIADMVRLFAAKPPAPGQSAYVTFDYPPAVSDAGAAVDLVRRRAADWGVDPHRIGFMGFSAGAITALKLAVAPGAEGRPDFVAAIYPPLEALPVPDDAPPLFGAIALDDGLFAGKGFGLIEAWRKSKRPVEFHLYEKSGHGFGMGKPGTTTTGWIDSFYAWMTMRKLMIAAPR